METAIEPGVYFELPEETYHKIPALSSSGIKRLMGSTMDFWAYSWMNPNKEEDDKETVAKLLGKAHHKALLEPVMFDDLYMPEVVVEEEQGGALRTIPEMKAYLKKVGAALTGTRPELIARIKDIPHSPQIWDDALDDLVKGRIQLKSATYRNLAQLRAVAQADPVISKSLSGGYPEVSIVWEEAGVLCKCRLDYWKPKAKVDIKTFGNPFSIPTDRAIIQAMSRYQYFIQAVWYSRGVKAAVKQPELWRDEPERAEDFGQYVEADAPFLFVFAQTGPAPVVRARIFPKGGAWEIGESVCDQALVTFKECQLQFGTAPWIDQGWLEYFDTDLFPGWAWD